MIKRMRISKLNLSAIYSPIYKINNCYYLINDLKIELNTYLLRSDFKLEINFHILYFLTDNLFQFLRPKYTYTMESKKFLDYL